ncbi:MgtC/SapB transporter [Parvibaculum lavamentivorans DS-1]|uniref:Protein MgtC n=1 Tax=Parvibaculum lavamentivorans (strain DS-1 / DSM 13023 / NCIMB 13966) TaxID=402881 RepID=A7HP48_PARL1|nr:MgtC/SapB family protein [Parvibaculum lavamentivorans]ABS61681.1 MgtC/SapB transporter [Parvibaculum lavamentivorans DS-1]
MDIGYLFETYGALDYLARLGAAAAMGGVIGLDREAHDRPAGLRTHMMTAMAAAIFTILTLELHEEFVLRGAHGTADPIRIIDAVTAGVAFLAAGAIIHMRGQVRGLTTGAGMWLAGALGVACGMEKYMLGGVALALAAIVLMALRPLEARLSHRRGNARENEDQAERDDAPPR